MIEGLTAHQHEIEIPEGKAVAAQYAWAGGQYCALHTPRGVVGCGLYDLKCADDLDMAVASARGTPAKPLRTGEDLLEAKIVGVTRRAGAMGIEIGMTGREALRRMLIPTD